MLIGPVLALLLVLLFYKKDVNHAGVVWVAPEYRTPPRAPQADLETAATGRWPSYAPPSEPMDLNDVFRRR
jgi:hypothetical protein